MAKILLGATLGDARGSVGGATYTKGRFGAVLRLKTSPVQPRTGIALTVRGLFASLSKAWANSLTDTQRAGWDSLAAANPRTNVFGNSITLTGLQMYQSVNRNLNTIGETPIDDPPPNLDVDGILTLSAVADASAHTIAVTFTATPLGADDVLAVYASGPQNAGRSFFGSKLKLIKYGAAATASPLAIGTEYEALFGALRVGNKIQIRAQVIRNSNGAASVPLSTDTTVVA